MVVVGTDLDEGGVFVAFWATAELPTMQAIRTVAPRAVIIPIPWSSRVATKKPNPKFKPLTEHGISEP